MPRYLEVERSPFCAKRPLAGLTRAGALGALLVLASLAPGEAFASDSNLPGIGALVIRAGLSLTLVLALIAALAYLVRSRMVRPSKTGQDALAHVARLDLGGRREIRLVAVKGHLLVVGVAPARIELLADYPGEAEGAIEVPEASSPLPMLRKLVNFP